MIFGLTAVPRSSRNETNGWRAGYDPIQRWLRVITTVVVLGVFVYLSVSPTRGADGVVVIALALGAVLLLLGYEGVVRLPLIGKDDDEKKKDDNV